MTDDRLGSHPFCIDRAWINVYRLADGTDVTVRMLRPEDREAFFAGFERLSPESRYFRFLHAHAADADERAAPLAAHGRHRPRRPLGMAQRRRRRDGVHRRGALRPSRGWRRHGGGGDRRRGPHAGARRRPAAARRSLRDRARARHPPLSGRNHGRQRGRHPPTPRRRREARRRRGSIAVYDLDVPGAPEAEPAHGILVRMLGSIARGLATLGPQDRGRRRASGTS
jgi:hypothetical protein